MSLARLLIANRGEVAVRVARAARALGIETVAIFSEDDAQSLHVSLADRAHALEGVGPAPYLDRERIVAAALATGCDAVHPGYGFLSESAAFASAAHEAGLVFVGPSAETLDLFGDKGHARGLARSLGIPVLAGTEGPTSLDEARAFFESLPAGGAMMIKAVAGGGGRGMRSVRVAGEIDGTYERCRSEALAAFGVGEVYVEEMMPDARHIEVQIVGDGTGDVVHLYERDCSLQRRHQKIVEIAPAPNLPQAMREAMLEAAVALARAARYSGVGTIEFLVDGKSGRFAFIEANARLQVEHPITEEVIGIDIVKTQLKIAGGKGLKELGLVQSRIAPPRGVALELRINMETLEAGGALRPGHARLGHYLPPTGPGLRVDGAGYPGLVPSPRFDSLLAKLVVHTPEGGLAEALAMARAGLEEFEIQGPATNIAFLRAVLAREEIAEWDVSTRLVDDRLDDLVEAAKAPGSRRGPHAAAPASLQPGGSVADMASAPPGTEAVVAPMAGTLVAYSVGVGDAVAAGAEVAVLEAMKMEHLVAASAGGVVRALACEPGTTVGEGEALLYVEPAEVAAAARANESARDLDRIRTDLAEALERHAITEDARRPEAVARRRKTGQRTARENVADLVDPGSFIEYGALALAAQRRRRSEEELLKMSPADGMIAGIGSVNGALFDEDRARTMVLAYDYTVLAGTQGHMNHKKKDRMLHLAERWRVPLVLFAEGGGGRPGDTDAAGVAGLDIVTFAQYAQLNALVPILGIVSGRCFAGNAALLGCSDVVIATENSTIGMGGPAMIEGGGLGTYAPEEVGPVAALAPAGVLDLIVPDETAAVAAAKKYLAYFQGPTANWTCADQRLLRGLVPENRLRVYDVRRVIEALADEGSVLELRREFGHGMITALVRVEGRPMGLVANNPMHLAGAIDSPGADKSARFMQLCDAHGLPLLFLCDTPGIMVGPQSERTGTVRHASRLFVTAANLSVPLFTVVLRKGYGLGAQTMAGGSFQMPFFTVSWPTGEFGGMGLEGAVRLGYRRELEAIDDPGEREAHFRAMVDRMYKHGKAVNMAAHLEIDDVIDPADTRRWIVRGLASVPKEPPRQGKRRTIVDTW
ncbi:MAG: carbamoyl-phosphate synthase large subunit [Alphaproteobacteria bacterium]|nr:carbamoyl-phosphate synthase large subunit [Alphaproteobacteria bacterium]